MTGLTRARGFTIAAIVAVVAVIFAALLLGGNDGSESAGSSAGGTVSTGVSNAAVAAPDAGGAAKSEVASGASGRVVDAAVTSTVTGTRVVKTGSLSLTVPRGAVAKTIAALTSAATSLGGYVSASHTDNVDGSPTGTLTLRIPEAQFDMAVSTATRLGHETALTTSAHDITGKYVDLSARANALKRTRSTYLTILGRAGTIGQTLSVQQRVNDIQEQIEALQGQLKVLRNQSSDGTLTVDVSQAGAVLTPVHHAHKGFANAWSISFNRFNRGLQGLIRGLGPLLLALLVAGAIYAVGWFGFRRVKRVTT